MILKDNCKVFQSKTLCMSANVTYCLKTKAKVLFSFATAMHCITQDRGKVDDALRHFYVRSKSS